MIMHNIEDDNVLFQDSVQMMAALERGEAVRDRALHAEDARRHRTGEPACKRCYARFLRAEIEVAPI